MVFVDINNISPNTRFFRLSRQCLTYSKAKGEGALCAILSHEMLAVERVDESAFGMKFVRTNFENMRCYT